MIRMCSLLLIAILVLVVSGCEGEGGGISSKAESASHRIYAAANNYMYQIDIPADTIVDSLALPAAGRWEQFQFSPDKQKIYTLADVGNHTLVYNAHDLSEAGTLPLFSPFYFDTASGTGLVDYNDRIYKFDLQSFAVSDSVMLPGMFTGGHMHKATHTYYACTGSENVLLIDYLTMEVSDTITVVDSAETVGVRKVFASPETGHLGLIGMTSTGRAAFAYDYINSRIVARERLAWSQYAAITGTSDGITCFAADPGDEFRGYAGSYQIWAFSFEQGVVVGRYPTVFNTEQYGQVKIDASALRITPDDRHLLAFGSIPGLIRFDLVTGQGYGLLTEQFPNSVGWAEVGGSAQ